LRERLAAHQRFYPRRYPDPPAVVAGLQLPTRLAAINEQVRILEALPDRVIVDRRTPTAAVGTWIMSLRIADRDAYVAVVQDDPELMGVFDDVTLDTGERDPRFMTHQIVSATLQSSSRATVVLSLTLGDRTFGMRIELALDANGWRVTKVES
jgi:hypothetical protein